eukprot:Polyplicarium_translucidae@DN1789_c0_g1_i2.p4
MGRPPSEFTFRLSNDTCDETCQRSQLECAESAQTSLDESSESCQCAADVLLPQSVSIIEDDLARAGCIVDASDLRFAYNSAERRRERRTTACAQPVGESASDMIFRVCACT